MKKQMNSAYFGATSYKLGLETPPTMTSGNLGYTNLKKYNTILSEETRMKHLLLIILSIQFIFLHLGFAQES